MSDPLLFKWCHLQGDIILCAARWYLRYALSDGDMEELLREGGVWVVHTTVYRWVQRYVPELDQCCGPYLCVTNDSNRFVKPCVNPGLRFGAFHTAQQLLHGYEALHCLRKGQLEGLARRDVLAQNRVINQQFGLAA